MVGMTPLRKGPTKWSCEARASPPQFVDRTQDVAGTLGELFAEGGWPDLSCASFEKGCAQQFLQFLDLQGQGRLGDGAGICGAPEVTMLCQCLEVAQML